MGGNATRYVMTKLNRVIMKEREVRQSQVLSLVVELFERVTERNNEIDNIF